MSNNEDRTIQPLVDNHIIRDATLKKTILAYISLVQSCTGKNPEELETEDVFCCAWFAVEHLDCYPCALIRDVHVASDEGARDFIQRLIRLRRLLLERIAGGVVAKKMRDHVASSDGPYTAPRTLKKPCTHCNKSDDYRSGDREYGAPRTQRSGNGTLGYAPQGTDLVPSTHASNAVNTFCDERPLTVKKPRIGASDGPEPPEAATPPIPSDDDDEEYRPNTDPRSNEINARRSRTLRATWAEKKRIGKQLGIPAHDVYLTKERVKAARERASHNRNGAEKARRTRKGRAARKGRREQRVGARPAGRDDNGGAPPPQLARRSTAFPKLRGETVVLSPVSPSNSPVAGPSKPLANSLLPSPPPSKRPRPSTDAPSSYPLPLPRLPAGAAESSSSQSEVRPQRKFGLASLRVAVRKVAEGISSYNEKTPCKDEDLLWLITDLKTRLDELTGMSSQVAAAQQSTNDSGLADLEELMLEKELEIVQHIRDHGCSNMRLRIMILDLSKRLNMQ